jgi:hypothetical protein
VYEHTFAMCVTGTPMPYSLDYSTWQVKRLKSGTIESLPDGCRFSKT